MSDVPVFYATSEGQTRRICERIASHLHDHGLDSRAISIRSDEASALDWRRVRGVVLGASIHMQKHQPEAVAFARRHHQALSVVPSLFVSVSLAAASKRASEVERAREIAEAFPAKAGWCPTHVASVAGRLAYTQYNWLVRRIMRRIAVQEGGSPDMTQDHEYTDWEQVKRFAEALAADIKQRETARASSPGLRAAG